MKRVLVAVKRVVDYNARIRVKADKVVLFQYCQHSIHSCCSILALCLKSSFN